MAAELRSRAELESLITTLREAWAPKVERFNYLVERRDRAQAEIERLTPEIDRYENATHDVDWEYFRRLQADGALPSLPRVIRPADDNHKNDGDSDFPEEDESDGRDGSEFEIGSKG